MSERRSGFRRFMMSRRVVVVSLGITQIFGYGTTFYLLAVLALPMSQDTGWPLDRIAIGLSIALLIGALVAPLIGRVIDRRGGRTVLMAGSLCTAIGLTAVGLSSHLFLYWLAWGVMGLGMAASLYEAAFSALGGWYREEARGPITAITLWGGFASTVCWPAGAFLVATTGWRWTCVIFAACHLFIALPLHAWMMPRSANDGAAPSEQTRAAPAAVRIDSLLFVLIAASMTFSAMIVTVISVHLIPVLQGNGYSAAAAVSIGALIGPSQVAGRIGELLVGHRLHPVWSALVAAILMVAGMVILTHNLQLAAIAIVVYAMGAGVSYVVRGTLPLAIFGSDGYATTMGRLATPSLIAQALAPWIAAIILERWTAGPLLYSLVTLTLINVVALGCVALSRRGERGT